LDSNIDFVPLPVDHTDVLAPKSTLAIALKEFPHPIILLYSYYPHLLLFTIFVIFSLEGAWRTSLHDLEWIAALITVPIYFTTRTSLTHPKPQSSPRPLFFSAQQPAYKPHPHIEDCPFSPPALPDELTMATPPPEEHSCEDFREAIERFLPFPQIAVSFSAQTSHPSR
jgi:hypothetical protein